MVAIGTVGLAVFLYIEVPKGFFPQQDTGRLNGNIIADQSISFQAMQQKIARLAAIAKQDPGVDTVLIFTGGGGGTTTNTGRVFIALKPLAVAQGERRSDHQPVATEARGRTRCDAVLCRPCRTCASAAARAPRSTNTPSTATACRP